MKKVFLIICLFFGLSLSAQFSMGVTGGINVGSLGDIEGVISGDDITSVSSNKVGFHLGIYTKLKFTLIYIRPELVYTRLTSEYRIESLDKTVDLSLNRIDIPVLVGFKVFPPLLSAFLGPTLRYSIINADDLKSLDDDDRVSYGAQIGLGLDIPKISFDVRWDFSLSSNPLDFETISDLSLDTASSQFLLSASIKL